MRLNPDCIRDILIFAENIEYGSQATLNDMAQTLDYTIEELSYTSLKLYEAGLIDGSFINIPRHMGKVLSKLYSPTFAGHEVLADIRNEKIWKPTKSIAKELGVSSVHALKDIATEVVSQIISKHIGF